MAIRLRCVSYLPQTTDWLVATKNGQPGASLRAALRDLLPARLADILADLLGNEFGAGRDLGNIPNKVLRAVEAKLAHWEFRPNGTEGYAKAEVTAGGIATSELSSRTMEAKSVSGLYAIGEAVDVTGWLGGYNFQWAWASGFAAGEAV